MEKTSRPLEVHTSVVNHPEFIEWQFRALKTFMKGDWNFVVFNDAKSWPEFTNFGDASMRAEIRRTCERLNVMCIDIPNDRHQSVTCPATRCADSMNFMVNSYRHVYNCGIHNRVLCIDSDMFPVVPMDASTLYADVAAAYVPQPRENLNYIWNGLWYMDFDKVWSVDKIDWCNGIFKNELCDVGGAMTYWLDEKPTNAQVYEIKHRWSLTWDEKCALPHDMAPVWMDFFRKDVKNQDGKFWCELYDERFMHYRAGGNWEHLDRSVHDERIRGLREVFEKVLI